MGQPTKSMLHYDKILSNLSQAIIQDAYGFVAPQIFPIVPVEKESDYYYIFDQEWFLRDSMQLRPRSTESVGTGFKVSKDKYNADVYALHHDIDDRDRKNADYDLEKLATRMLTSQALQRLERSFVTEFLTTGKWETDVTGVAGSPSAGQFRQWNDVVTSDPIGDIDTAVDKISQASGLKANTMVLGRAVFRKLVRHPLVREQFGANKADNITAEQLASIFDVDRIFVANAIKATNKEGQALTTDFIVGKVAWVGYVAPNAGMEVASAGYTFNWNQDIGGGDLSQAPISIFRMDELKSDRVETELAFDQKVVSRPLGYLFSSAVA